MAEEFEQLPIPDWGLICPHCAYPLRGLPSHRCPECGQSVDVSGLIRPWTRLRDPRFKGTELPWPDFGLACPACKAPLAGATTRACPACAAAFDPEAWRPPGIWFVLDRTLCWPLGVPAVQAMLEDEDVPLLPVAERSLAEIWGGISITVRALRVPTEFFFEVLWLLQRERHELHARRTAARRPRWHCPSCGEPNPGHFDVCWNCQHTRPDAANSPE